MCHFVSLIADWKQPLEVVLLCEGGEEFLSLNKDIWDILRVELRMLAEANLHFLCKLVDVFHIPFLILPLAKVRHSPKYVYLLMVGYQLCPNGR